MLLLYRRVLLPPSTPYLLCCFRVSNCALVCFCLWFIELRLFEVFDMAGFSAPTPLHPTDQEVNFITLEIIPLILCLLWWLNTLKEVVGGSHDKQAQPHVKCAMRTKFWDGWSLHAYRHMQVPAYHSSQLSISLIFPFKIPPNKPRLTNALANHWFLASFPSHRCWRNPLEHHSTYTYYRDTYVEVHTPILSNPKWLN